MKVGRRKQCSIQRLLREMKGSEIPRDIILFSVAFDSASKQDSRAAVVLAR